MVTNRFCSGINNPKYFHFVSEDEAKEVAGNLDPRKVIADFFRFVSFIYFFLFLLSLVSPWMELLRWFNAWIPSRMIVLSIGHSSCVCVCVCMCMCFHFASTRYAGRDEGGKTRRKRGRAGRRSKNNSIALNRRKGENDSVNGETIAEAHTGHEVQEDSGEDNREENVYEEGEEQSERKYKEADENSNSDQSEDDYSDEEEESDEAESEESEDDEDDDEDEDEDEVSVCVCVMMMQWLFFAMLC
jgi:hypothetical protein